MSDEVITIAANKPVFNLKDVDVGDASFDLDKERLALAKHILLALLLFNILVFMVNIMPDCYFSDRLKDLSSSIFQSSVPIASLVIGYYFGKS